MYLKYIFIFLIIYSKSLFAESYFDNLKIINNYNEGITYNVEVVKSQRGQELGLMYRKKLEKKTGMLFIFKKRKKGNFLDEKYIHTIRYYFYKKKMEK